MKTLLISTDFSRTATHAAMYGYNLAKQIKANVILCNAVIVPAEIPQAGVVVWPMEEYNVLMEDSDKELKSLRTELENKNTTEGFNPQVKIINETGRLTDIVNMIVKEHQADVVIMGTHAEDSLSTLILGNHTRRGIWNFCHRHRFVGCNGNIGNKGKLIFALANRSNDPNFFGSGQCNDSIREIGAIPETVN